jgi:hypothetical protein
MKPNHCRHVATYYKERSNKYKNTAFKPLYKDAHKSHVFYWNLASAYRNGRPAKGSK